MSTVKQKVIKAITNFRRLGPEVVVSTSEAIQAHFDKNPNATAPLPVDMVTVKSATDLLSARIAAAADGGKQPSRRSTIRRKSSLVSWNNSRITPR